MTRCDLNWRCKRIRKSGICCFSCGIHDTCMDACYNSPGKCHMDREATTMEKVRDLNITFIKSSAEFQSVLKTGKPIGMFWRPITYYGYLCIDNRTGAPVLSRRFDEKEDALNWLIDRAEGGGRTWHG